MGFNRRGAHWRHLANTIERSAAMRAVAMVTVGTRHTLSAPPIIQVFEHDHVRVVSSCSESLNRVPALISWSGGGKNVIYAGWYR